MNENEIQIRVQQELQKLLSDPRKAIKLYSEALQQAEEENSQLQTRVSELVPKGEAYDNVVEATNTIDMKNIAKTLHFKEMGRNNLFEYLRNKGVLDRWNKPYQEYAGRGYFKIDLVPYEINGEKNVYPKTVVTTKGMDYIRRILREDGYDPIER
jgi:anti-repressor protein